MKTTALSVAIATGLLALAAVPHAQQAAELPMVQLMRAAVLDRMGRDADVHVTLTSAPADLNGVASARVDPSARLGRPMRFTLVVGVGRTATVMADVRVTVDYAVAARAINRGDVLTAADVKAVRGVLTNVGLRRVPTVDGLVGGRALRPIDSGLVIEETFVAARKVVSPGDRVTVVASTGAIEVTASFVAADGGGIGDVIRVVNPATKKYLRGRITRPGVVEVIHDR